MARQAKRKKPAKAKSPRKPSSGITRSCFGFLVTGFVVGMLATVLFQGWQTNREGAVGSGLREMMNQSREADAARHIRRETTEPVLVSREEALQKPKYDFYTVLPGLEEVLPKDAPEPPPVSAVKATQAEPPGASVATATATAPATAPAAEPVYVLQVASYGRNADAEKLKAELTLRGWSTAIQTVSIDSKTYYRVRVGPFVDYGNMTAVDYELARMGHQTLRLRVSR